jgi:tetratricopeptide (TPR) repeat protein
MNSKDVRVNLQALFTVAAVVCMLQSGVVQAQLITMSKDCRAQVASGDSMNDGGDFQSAVNLFSSIAEDCDTQDGKVAVRVGLARAYNGLGQYNDAITYADKALNASEQTSLDAFFEKALAEESLGNTDAAMADYDTIIALTEKNENVRERATIYAKVADLNYRTGQASEAQSYINRAIKLDPENPSFNIQKGDWAANDGDYERAFAEFDQAVAKGRTDADMYGIRADTRVKMLQEKYGMENVQQLRAEMTAEEKDQVCMESRKALDLGLRDMQMDMFVALVCR